jgi:cytochrome c oxidase cbb3-type subunit III
MQDRARAVSPLAVVAAVSVAVSVASAACSSEPTVNQQGQKLYANYCALCHGADGEGYAADQANALNNQDFLAIASDDFLRAAITRGRPSTVMSAWGVAHFGPLSGDDVDDIVEFTRAWQTAPSITLAERPHEGSAARGAALYEFNCADCHGADGQGGDYISIANPEFLATASDSFLRHVIEQGRNGTAMTRFGDKLTAQGTDDIIALLRSWQTPPAENPDAPPEQDLSELIQNPDGPDPVFTAERYVPADEVKAALDAGEALGMLDARPASDYLQEHIAGAMSVPFYAADDFADKLPKDRWLITYCGCPHAESGALADALTSQGFDKVRILDEGFYFWKEQGYPVNTGAAP